MRDARLSIERGAEALDRTIARAGQQGVTSAQPVNGNATTGEIEGSSVCLIRADTIAPEPIRWIWKDWLAAGKLHVLAGRPGAGKTTLALTLAATISSSGRWPDGSRAEVGNVLIWSGEDGMGDTIVPRLIINR